METKIKQCNNCKKKFELEKLKEVILKEKQEKVFYCLDCYNNICDKCKKINNNLFQVEKNKYCIDCYKEFVYDREMEELKEVLKEEFKGRGSQGGLLLHAKEILYSNFDITPKDIIMTIKYIKEIKKEKLESGLSSVSFYLEEALRFYDELEIIRKENEKRIEIMKENLKKVSQKIKEEEKEREELKGKKIYKKPPIYGLIDMESALEGGEKFKKESLHDG